MAAPSGRPRGTVPQKLLKTFSCLTFLYAATRRQHFDELFREEITSCSSDELNVLREDEAFSGSARDVACLIDSISALSESISTVGKRDMFMSAKRSSSVQVGR